VPGRDGVRSAEEREPRGAPPGTPLRPNRNAYFPILFSVV